MMLSRTHTSQPSQRLQATSSPALPKVCWAAARVGGSVNLLSNQAPAIMDIAQRHLEESRRNVVVLSTSSSAVATTGLPFLTPLDDDYERKLVFGDFANWILPGYVMVGRYPYCEPSRCNSHELGEAQLEKVLEQGITTFVSLQGEVPPQEKMTLSGKNGFLPYKSTAELIKSSMSPPPSMEVMMKLRNPTLDKFLPPRKRVNPNLETKPSYELSFVHFPITDLSIPDAAQLAPFLDQLTQRIQSGEKLYIHCWGGRGRAGTVAACLLAKLYGLSADEALERVQRAFSTRQDTKERSPETDEQHEFVKKFVASLKK